MNGYDQTLDLKLLIHIGRRDLISQFSVFSSPEPLGSQGELIGWP